MNNTISNSISNKWHVQIQTNLPSRENYNGIIIKDINGFLIFHEFFDFQYNGIMFINKNRIKSIRDNDFEVLANKMIRFNKEILKCKRINWVNQIKSTKDIIGLLMKKNIWPGIEIIDKKKKSSFYVGPITRLNKINFGLYCYDAKGNWESEYRLNYNEIYRILVFDPYTHWFNKYMKKYNPKTKSI